MKHFFYRAAVTVSVFILIPILFTLFIQGTGDDPMESLGLLTETEAGEDALDEDLLIGILANEISMETEAEAMKAQAVIARTNCLRAIEQGENLPEGLEKEEMIRLWGQESFSEYYSLLESSILETRGVAAVCGGSYIKADFHRCSAGYTRDAEEVYGNGEYPYLKRADCRRGLTTEDFLTVAFYTPKQFIAKGEALFSEETRAAASEITAQELLEKIQITKKDQAGYVTELTVDGGAHSGEEVRLLYDFPSAAFSLKEVDGEIRVVTKGLGHGLGVSLYTANELAKEGLSYKEILNYFYAEIEFVTQYP